MRRRVGLLAAALVPAAVLGGCSSKSTTTQVHGSTTTTTATTSTSAGQTTTSRPATTTSSVASTSTTNGSAVAGGCASTDLAASVVGQQGAAGTQEVTVALRNASAASCGLDGYPGLQLVSSSGTALATVVVRGGSYSFTTMAPAATTVQPGKDVYFNLGYSDVPTGNESSCPTSASVEVTPPNAYGHLGLALRIAPCNGGSVTVSPVFVLTPATTMTTAPG